MTDFQKLVLIVFGICIFCAGCPGHKRDEFSALIPGFVKDSIYLDPENRFTKEKATLGRYLFYDRRLSVNNTKACASCHAQEFSFTDSYNRSAGALGDLHQRNAKPLINIVFEKYLTAADSSLHFPEQQINNPMFNTHPAEMGMKGNEKIVLQRIKDNNFYQQQFKKAFPGARDPVTIKNIQYSITSFVKTIFSFNSPYDNYFFRNADSAMNEATLNGRKLFFSNRLNCSTCHNGSNFSTPLLKKTGGSPEFYFNTGLYSLDSSGSYPKYDQGLIALTNSPADMGKYKVSGLRNLAFTAPYFHDGSAATLEEVITVYENGGQNILAGDYTGDGRKNPHKHPLISGFRLNSQERKELISFLLSLSDSSVLKNPAYANPFTEDETEHNKQP